MHIHCQEIQGTWVQRSRSSGFPGLSLWSWLLGGPIHIAEGQRDTEVFFFQNLSFSYGKNNVFSLERFEKGLQNNYESLDLHNVLHGDAESCRE